MKIVLNSGKVFNSLKLFSLLLVLSFASLSTIAPKKAHALPSYGVSKCIRAYSATKVYGEVTITNGTGGAVNTDAEAKDGSGYHVYAAGVRLANNGSKKYKLGPMLLSTGQMRYSVDGYGPWEYVKNWPYCR